MAAVGYNFKLLLAWFPALLCVLSVAVVDTKDTQNDDAYPG
jgi:hypothetical protein